MNTDLAKSETLWRSAASFAARAHAGQLRKDGRTPYVAHVYRVAMTVRHLFGNDNPTVLAAALLHDTIEDTTTDFDDLVEHFGPDVARLVASLTKDSRLPDSEREPAYDRVLMAAGWEARLIKLADVLDNWLDAHSGQQRDKSQSKVQRALACAGDDPRLAHAVRIVRELVGL